jgi:hypothetical protein
LGELGTAIFFRRENLGRFEKEWGEKVTVLKIEAESDGIGIGIAIAVAIAIAIGRKGLRKPIAIAIPMMASQREASLFSFVGCAPAQGQLSPIS